MKNKVIDIWEELRLSSINGSGFIRRRFSAYSNGYIALNSKSKKPLIYFEIKEDCTKDIAKFAELKEISIDIQKANIASSSNDYFLIIILEDLSYMNIFGVLCEDLLFFTENIIEDSLLVNKILNRLNKWVGLLKKNRRTGLSVDEQKGLYGELFFLDMLFEESSDWQTIIDSWQGGELLLHDFRKNTTAIEVKTSTGINSKRVQIANERQLDTSVGTTTLFLYHLYVERIKNSNNSTLNTLVDLIRLRIRESAYIYNLFNYKLIEYGYFDQDKDLYDSVSYEYRSDTFYIVRDNFPRIELSDLREGVEDVKYSISLVNVDHLIQDKKNVIKTFLQ